MIASLLHERAGYLRVGKMDRVALVDVELRKRGYEVEPQRPVGRSMKPQETTAESAPIETAEVPAAESVVEDAPVEEKPKRRGRPRLKRDENGNVVRDENGNGIPEE